MGLLTPVLRRVAPPSGGERFPALDGLRAVAALAVVLTHLPAGIPAVLKGYGVPAVSIFFALSAFLLYYPHVAGKKPDVKSYYRRRLARIYPAYVVALGLAVGVLTLCRRPVAWQDVATHLAFSHTWFEPYAFGLIAPAWSLATEVQFYLLLPLLVLFLRRRAVLRLALAGVVVFGLQLAVYAANFTPVQVRANLPFAALPFLFGMIAAHAVHARLRVPRLLVWLALVGLLVNPFPAPWFPEGSQAFRKWFLVIHPRCLPTSLCAALLVAALATAQRHFLALSLVRALGVCGYGIFLFHGPIITALNHGFGPTPTLLALLLTPVVAVLSFVYIEAPAMHYAARRRQVPVDGASGDQASSRPMAELGAPSSAGESRSSVAQASACD